MAKVKDLFPSSAPILIDATWLKDKTLADIWAKYDDVTDSMLIYVTGKPVPGVNVYLQEDIYAIVDLHDNNKIVGLYFEAWEEIAAKFDIVTRSWSEIRETSLSGTDASLTLRLLALVMLMMIGKENASLLQSA